MREVCLRTRIALIPALLAVASLGLAGCGSASGPPRPVAAAAAAPGPAGTLSLGVTDGRLGDAITDTSGGGLRELSPGGPIDPAAVRRAPNLREGVGAGDACANAALQPDAANLATVAEATLCLLNGERADRGLATLRLNDRLQRAALGHGNDMVEHPTSPTPAATAPSPPTASAPPATSRTAAAGASARTSPGAPARSPRRRRSWPPG